MCPFSSFTLKERISGYKRGGATLNGMVSHVKEFLSDKSKNAIYRARLSINLIFSDDFFSLNVSFRSTEHHPRIMEQTALLRLTSGLKCGGVKTYTG